ncbi:glycoprotein [Ralstonia solanacearum]|uniref:Glycoprotein n=2 Tax=Ralstonia solanacearum TaxID=305 RepID=A0A177RJ10_RALSL|nr:glycoprotein [Ralstonia solanacearum]
MPSLSPTSPTFRRRAVRTLIAMTLLAALVALPRVRASTSQPAPDVAPAPTGTAAAESKANKNPTCQAIMQRLSGSLAGTPSQTGGKKTAAVLVDVDKAGVTMACSHSDAVAIPVPTGTKTR